MNERYEAVSINHFWHVVDNEQHIWVASFDVRYFKDAEKLAYQLAERLMRESAPVGGSE